MIHIPFNFPIILYYRPKIFKPCDLRDNMVSYSKVNNFRNTNEEKTRANRAAKQELTPPFISFYCLIFLCAAMLTSAQVICVLFEH
ncbi:hypothetical protein JHK85_032425 [Glycine max]|nr:hypothetical protein JHK85_032425 [Glycine max]